MYCWNCVAGWLSLLAVLLNVIVGIEAVEFMRVDSDFGELLLIKNKTVAGDWSVLYVEKGIYFRRDSSRRICAEYQNYYRSCNKYKDFLPKDLMVLQSSQTNFPIGLFEFWAFNRLQNLQMSRIGLTEFQRAGLVGADALKILDLSHNELMEMPSKAFSSAWNLTEVDLSYNEITSMASDVFKVEFENVFAKGKVSGMPTASSFLKVIRLNNNNLTFIDSEWFSNLSYLTTLTLNDNFLAEISACSVFSTNNALRALYLQNNEFATINTTGFISGQCLNQLDTFDISNNPKRTDAGAISVDAKVLNITSTNSQQCIIPQSAVIVRASLNRIDSVLVQLPNTQLTYLYLNHNKIDSIDFLVGLEHLEEINLSHNALTQLSAKVFDNLLRLKRLDISYNKFATIDFGFIESTTAMQYFDISNNLLTGHFDLNAGGNVLTTLNISNNNYTSMQHNLRKRMPSLTHIDLNGNLFNCEDLTTMLLFMHFDHITPVIRSENESSEENNVRGVKCHQPKDDFSAKNSTKSNYNTTREVLTKTIDTKLANLETKLIDLFYNARTEMFGRIVRFHKDNVRKRNE